MRRLACLAILALAVTVGCKKEEQATPSTNQPAGTDRYSPQNQPQPAVQRPAPAPAPAVNPDAGPDLAAINRDLRRWIVGHQRPPKSFEEFAATTQVPPPPPGKKYVLTSQMRILLVDK